MLYSCTYMATVGVKGLRHIKDHTVHMTRSSLVVRGYDSDTTTTVYDLSTILRIPCEHLLLECINVKDAHF